MTESEADPVAVAKFDAAMEEIYRNAKREVAYNASRFLVKVKELGGLQAAQRLLAGERVRDGALVTLDRGRRGSP